MRHGENKHNSYNLDMDSADWADTEVTISNVNHENDLDATFDDLVLLAVTGPKGRLQLGIVVEGPAEEERMIASFVRVNQGSSIPFVREDRVAHVISPLDERLVARYEIRSRARNSSCGSSSGRISTHTKFCISLSVGPVGRRVQGG